MTNSRTSNGRAGMGDLLKEQVANAQARVEQIEGEARQVLEDLMRRGRASRRDLEQLVHRISKQDWTFAEVRQKFTRLQAKDLVDRAEAFRAEAVERVMELQGRAVQFLGAASRSEVEELSRELDKLSRRLDRAEKATRGKKAGKPSSREV